MARICIISNLMLINGFRKTACFKCFKFHTSCRCLLFPVFTSSFSFIYIMYMVMENGWIIMQHKLLYIRKKFSSINLIQNKYLSMKKGKQTSSWYFVNPLLFNNGQGVQVSLVDPSCPCSLDFHSSSSY